ncbi:S-adenosyl-L-methionine-dependent methyltransferase [Phycomyces nitens]|nr:S-adenosyl-L-methionine-dependent methyltransferase [Phycomyces nitens]
MGNQASRAIERTRERRIRPKKTSRRHSTATVGCTPLSISRPSSPNSFRNRDWLESLTGSFSSSYASTDHESIPPTAFAASQSSPRPISPCTPHDPRELDRLQRQHYLLKLARKTNCWAPCPPQSATILDIGTGNGIWAFEMAAEYRDAKVIGLDLLPPTRQLGCPENLYYIQSDIHHPWPIASSSIDRIHQRDMGQMIQGRQWARVLQEMYRVLKPGGTIELVESDLWYHNPGPMQQTLRGYLESYYIALGLDVDYIQGLGQWIVQAGFGPPEVRTLDLPIGEWSKDGDLKQFGFIHRETQKAWLKNKKSFHITRWNITSEQYDHAIQEVLDEWDSYHSYSRYHCWVATKPAG